MNVIHSVPAEPVSGVFANIVTADVVIGVDGGVESVSVVDGDRAHHASAVAALQQHRFAPVEIDGAPARVVLQMDVHVPDTLSDAALAKVSRSTTTSIVVHAKRNATLD